MKFELERHGTTVRTELTAGTTTFLTMAYIIFVQPAVLSGSMFGMETGMDFGAVTTATCLAAALATVIMALYARYPIAQAPGMGQNFFFVFSVIPAATAAGYRGWQAALGTVFIAGVLFLAVSLCGLRVKLLDAVSPSMKNSIAVGIGLFIAFIGLQNAGLVVPDPGTAVKLNPGFASPDTIIFAFGLLLTAVLHVRGVRGSILWGILGATLLALALRSILPYLAGDNQVVAESQLMTRFRVSRSLLSAPPSLSPTLFKMDLAAALAPALWPFIIIFLFMDLFDTVGTLIGVSEQGGFMRGNKLPRAQQAMLSDAAATVAGACMGTSTVTSFIESSAGIEQGGRTGLTALTVAGWFLVALFFSPVIAMVGSYAPVTAPALVVVGAMMMRNVTKIEWRDFSEAIPGFLIIGGIPMTYSIADGLSLGFMAYPIIKWCSGRKDEVSPVMTAVAVLLVFYFIFVRAGI